MKSSLLTLILVVTIVVSSVVVLTGCGIGNVVQLSGSLSTGDFPIPSPSPSSSPTTN